MRNLIPPAQCVGGMEIWSIKKRRNEQTMRGNPPTQSIFQRPIWVSLFALTAAVAWGWAYPLIKLGFAEFGITQGMTGSKMVFAGIRFSLSGVIILLMAQLTGRDFHLRSARDS